MLELSATNFEKGIFELKLEQAELNPILKLGPVKGRLVALVLFVAAGFILYFHLVARGLMEAKLVEFYPQAVRVQSILVWGLVGVGLVLYALILALCKESVLVSFDRSRAQIHYRVSPKFSFNQAKEDLASFKEIKALKVFSANQEPKTPYGYIEIEVPTLADASLQHLRFQFLSDDQFRIYPLNISKMVEIEPSGDWVNTDDLPLQTR